MSERLRQGDRFQVRDYIAITYMYYLYMGMKYTDKRRFKILKATYLFLQENDALREQVMVFKEKEINLKSFDDELASLDDTTSGKFCRKVRPLIVVASILARLYKKI